MPRPIHFEIHTENPERAIAFYEGLFGWLSYVEDPDGNILGLMQSDATAR
jgi:predicted enzyme related to lactoylglutathione lyase